MENQSDSPKESFGNRAIEPCRSSSRPELPKWLPLVVSMMALIWSIYFPVYLNAKYQARDAFLSGQRAMFHEAVSLTGAISQNVAAHKEDDPSWQAFLALVRGEALVFSEPHVTKALNDFKNAHDSVPRIPKAVNDAAERVAACVYRELATNAGLALTDSRAKLCSDS